MKTAIRTLVILLALSFSVFAQAQAEHPKPQPSAPIKGWEYLRIWQTTDMGGTPEILVEHSDGSVEKTSSCIKTLNEAGAHGWEVVTVHEAHGDTWRNIIYLLKRERR